MNGFHTAIRSNTRLSIFGLNILKDWIEGMPLIRRLALFGVAGVTSNAANIGAFWLCVNFVALSLPLSGSIAYFLGMFVGFYMNHKFTFAGPGRVTSRFISYVAIQLLIFCIYLAMNVSLIMPFPEVATIMHVLAVVICAIVNFCLINFIWKRYGKS